MKIVITRFGDFLVADGINLFIFELSDALIRLGQEVYVISGCSDNIPWKGNVAIFEKAVKEIFSVTGVPEPISLSYRLHTTSRYSSSIEENLLFTSKGSIIVSKLSPDMVIFNGATTMFCPFFKVAVGHDLQFRYRIVKQYDRFVYRMFNRIVAASTEIKHGLTSQLRIPAAGISVIPICIDTSRFSPKSRNKRRHAILHIGTRPEKRPDITVEAFEKIAQNDPEIELIIAGQIDPRVPPLLSQIKQKSETVRKRISFVGRVSKEELAELYSSVEATCVPSDYVVPVCSPTVIESLASGTPVVGSLSAISQDILIDGETGFRVQFGDVAMFAAKLSSLINNDDLWRRMSQKAIGISQRCDKMKVAQAYLSLHEKYAK
jgi:glycosyltransferase involved in cell wall biosynthesis